MAHEGKIERQRRLPAYGDQVSVFPVHLGDGTVVWMRAREDMPWEHSRIVWCERDRLAGLWRTAGRDRPRIGVSYREEQWHMVDRCFANSLETPVPVGYGMVNYHRRSEPLANLLEVIGLYGFLTKPVLGFVDGRHRTAWLLSRGAQLIPIMTDTWWALSNFAGSRVVPIDLAQLRRPLGIRPGERGRRPPLAFFDFEPGLSAAAGPAYTDQASNTPAQDQG